MYSRPGNSDTLILGDGSRMGEGRFEKLIRQHVRLQRARDHAFAWCAVFALLVVLALASLTHELTSEAQPNIVGQIALIVLALPVIFLTFRAGRRHHRAMKAMTASRDAD